MLLAAADIGRASGLRYVYAGNLPGSVGDLEDTRCAACGDVVVARYGYHIRDYQNHAGRPLSVVRHSIPGRWSRRFDGQIASRPFIPGRRGIQFKVLSSDF